MDKRRLKETIINACKKQLQETINHIQSAVDDAQNGANEYGQPKDRYDSYKAQLYRKRDMFAQQLQKAIEQMEILHKIDPKDTRTEVGFGSIVITDKQKLIVAIGLGKLNVEGDDYFCISPLVPIYDAIKGKKANDTCEFRGNEIVIKEVF
jgi:hypothetical protein